MTLPPATRACPVDLWLSFGLDSAMDDDRLNRMI